MSYLLKLLRIFLCPIGKLKQFSCFCSAADLQQIPINKASNGGRVGPQGQPEWSGGIRPNPTPTTRNSNSGSAVVERSITPTRAVAKSPEPGRATPQLRRSL